MTVPLIYIDTEFCNSHHKNMGVVCASMTVSTGKHQRTQTYWTHRNGAEQGRLRNDIRLLKNGVFFAYLASAECRALESIGIDAMELQWVDLFVEWKQLKMNNNHHSFGRYLRKNSVGFGGNGLEYGKGGHSVPPSHIKAANEGQDNTEVGNGYADAVYHLLNIKIDSARKTKMRDIIIRGDYQEIEDHRKEISEYCENDIEHLPALWNVMSEEICRNFKLPLNKYKKIALSRGRFAGPVTARVEREGIPFNLEAANYLSENVGAARDSLIAAYCESVEYPFITRQKRTLGDFKGHWGDRYALFEKYVLEAIKMPDWPTTESGRLSRQSDDLKEYSGDPNIGAYRQVTKALKGLESFDPDSKAAKAGMVMDSVDPEDNRLRILFGVFGTMTGRNAPRARRFPFAMGRWARSLVKPPAGWSVGSIDYASQEFMVAATLSGDPNMIAAYESGDPYLYFAKAAGAVPWEGTKHEYPEERKLFKSTTLGLQFGMGKDKLARKLTVDCGRTVTIKEASKLIQLHRKVYHVYWKWAKGITNTYKRDGFILLADGFGLNAHCDRETSVRNFPVQGTAAAVLRRAMILAVETGVRVVSPLHDAIYFCCPDEEYDEQLRLLSNAMTQAVHEILGPGTNIRQDVERHGHGHVWIEEGAEDVYRSLEPFMSSHTTPEKKRREFIRNLFDTPNF